MQVKILSNRSLAYLKAGKFRESLEDAETCCSMAPTWDKIHFRKAQALLGLSRRVDAVFALQKAYTLSLKGATRPPGAWRGVFEYSNTIIVPSHRSSFLFIMFLAERQSTVSLQNAIQSDGPGCHRAGEKECKECKASLKSCVYKLTLEQLGQCAHSIVMGMEADKRLKEPGVEAVASDVMQEAWFILMKKENNVTSHPWTYHVHLLHWLEV